MTKLATTSLVLAVTCAAAALAISGTPTAHAQTASALTIRDAWLRQPTGDRKQAGAFAVVENSSATARAIVSASADIADKAELHEMKMAEGMMRMSPVKRIDVPAHGKAELKPGGYHVMLFGLKKMPMAGDTFTLTLTFDDGSTASATASVRRNDGLKMNDAAVRGKRG
jgi:copper(I)-binding protein